jgi:hypothetical protein
MRGGKSADQEAMVAEARNGSLEATDEVTTDWLIETVRAELIRQEPVIGREFVPLGRMSQVTRGPGGALKVFFGVRCECRTSAVVSFEAASDKTRSEVLEALPQTGRQLLGQRAAFRNMPCSAHDKLRTRMFEQT